MCSAVKSPFVPVYNLKKIILPSRSEFSGGATYRVSVFSHGHPVSFVLLN